LAGIFGVTIIIVKKLSFNDSNNLNFMKKLFGFLLLLLLPFSFISAASNFSNPDDSSLFPDTWTNGTSENIAWNATMSPNKLLLFRNTGSGNVFIKNIGTPSVGAKSYVWLVDISSVGSGYRVALCPTAATSPSYIGCVYSDGFNINGEPTQTPTTSITPIVTVTPSTVRPGGSATLNWDCSPRDKCYCNSSLLGGNATGQLILPGSKNVSPTETTTYNLQCRDKTVSSSVYSARAQAVLTVSTAPDPVKMVLSANNNPEDLKIKAGDSVIFDWKMAGLSNGANFSGCRRDSSPKDVNWDVAPTATTNLYPFGSTTIVPTTSTTYSISCWKGENNYSDTRRISVEGSVMVPPVITPTATTSYPKFACKKQRERVNLFFSKYVYRCVEDPTSTTNRTQCLASCDLNTGFNSTSSTSDIAIPPTTSSASCQNSLPSLSVGDVFYNLRNNKPVTILSSDFNRWTTQNEAEIKENIDAMSVCHATPAMSSAEMPVQALQGAKKYTDKGIPTMITLVEGPKLFHMVVALQVTPTSIFPGYYKLKILDPNGPSVVTIKCQPQLTTVAPGQPKKRVTVCENPSGVGVVIPLQTNKDEEWYKITDQLAKNKVRDNPAAWLENNYAQFNNFTTATNNIGVCTGISEFNIRAAFLLKTLDQSCPVPVSFWNTSQKDLVGFIKNVVESIRVRFDF
jgi:hypothetical protein